MPPIHPIPRSILLGLTALGFLSSTASAGDGENMLAITTTADNYDGFDQKCSLREALYNANDNFAFSDQAGECPAGSASETDVIVLQSGEIYTLSLPGSSDFNGDLDVIDDPALADASTDLRIVTNGEAIATLRQSLTDYRVMKIAENARVEIANVVLRDGNVSGTDAYGGGLLFEGASLLLDRVSVTGNVASGFTRGGGVAIMSGSATLIDSSIAYNEATEAGGIYSSAPIVLRRTIIQGNTSQRGGGIYTTSMLTVEDASQFLLNNANYGGGIYAVGNDASVVVSDALFEKNTSQHDGGAVLADLVPQDDAARVSFDNTRFVDNKSLGGTGGAISSYGVKITGGEFIGNNTGIDGQGGAIYGDSVYLDNSVLEQNSSGQGGALFVGRELSATDCRFAFNTAAEGGAVYLLGGQNAPPSSVVRGLLRGNVAQTNGGAVWTQTPALTMANTTISGNSVATGTGSALFVEAGGAVTAINATVAWNAPGISIAKFGELTLKNSIVTSPDTINCEATQASPLIVSLGNNLSDDSSCVGLNAPGDKTNVDVLLAPLADNGGDTLTCALLDGSPAIDAGDGIACAAEPVGNVDQRGATRQSGLNCDIGAFEKAIAPTPKPIALFRDEFETL